MDAKRRTTTRRATSFALVILLVLAGCAAPGPSNISSAGREAAMVTGVRDVKLEEIKEPFFFSTHPKL
ncbi:MAG TPA: hypothetical protein VFB54_11390 [Burkholderiales bacterium]|nr:hypothetical protein [Burkholderiales bacterium]